MTQLTDSVFAVKIPEDAKNVRIIGNNHQCINCKVIKSGREEYDVIKLPYPGSYTLLFCSKGVTEDDAKKVVEYARTFGYRDYEAPNGAYQWCSKPLQSWGSLLKSKNISGNHAILFNKI